MAQTLQVQLDQVGPTTSKGTARSHSVIVDRPLAKGGEDRGPLGGEYLLFGLGGCFLSNLLAAVRAREAPVANVQVAVTGTIDGPPERFTAMTMTVRAECDDADLLSKLVTMAERACIVTNTLRDHVDLQIHVEARAAAAR